MTERQRLPNRRRSENMTFELDGLPFTATISRFPDGRVFEAFLNNRKHGNQSDTNARDAAILLSLACSTARTSMRSAKAFAATVKAARLVRLARFWI